jgi:hypothetical protein
MANRIDASSSTQIQTGSVVMLDITIKDSTGATISNKVYVFDAHDFSAAYDTQNSQIGTLHLGCCNSLTISNADYDQFYYNGASKASPVALIGDIIQDVAQYAF